MNVHNQQRLFRTQRVMCAAVILRIFAETTKGTRHNLTHKYKSHVERFYDKNESLAPKSQISDSEVSRQVDSDYDSDNDE